MPRPIGIRIHRGNELVESQVFDRDIIKIGRLASAHLRLEDPKVSRIHAVIDIANGNEVSIIDMGSAEGTRVNGDKVSRVRLKNGDEVGLGDSRLVVVLDETEIASMRGEGAAAPAPAPAAAAPDTTDLIRDVPPPPMPPPSTGVFASGETDIQSLRLELQAEAPAPPSTDVFTAPPPVDVAPPPPVASAPVVAAPVVAAPVVAAPVVAAPAPPPRAAPRAAQTAPTLSLPPGILPPLPPIPEDAITPENRFVEVTVRWGSTVVDVRRLRNIPKFTLGPGKEDDIFIPLDGAASSSAFDLLRASEGQGWRVRFTDKMGGTVTRGEQTVPLAQSGASVDGDAYALPLTDDTHVVIALAYHTIEVRPVSKSRIVPIAPFFDTLWANTSVITMFATAAVLAVVNLMPIGMDSLEDDLLTNPTKFQTLILKPPPKDNSFLNRLNGPKEQKQAAQKDQGAAGDKKADPKKDKGRMAMKAEKPKPTNEEVVQSKIAALFGDKGNAGIAQMFGAEANGGELQAALGNIDGSRVAAGYGTGGLGLRGGGPGGGGTGVATLGTGRIGTRGRGSGDSGYGSADGGMGAKQERDVSMTIGKETVFGSLDPEIIRRIVREHAGQIRYCYEHELTTTPGIYGKIVMKWVINGEGKVTQSQVAETQMKNSNVENCLATKIKTWTFPKPKGGGIVIVNYPFVFKQSG